MLERHGNKPAPSPRSADTMDAPFAQQLLDAPAQHLVIGFDTQNVRQATRIEAMFFVQCPQNRLFRNHRHDPSFNAIEPLPDELQSIATLCTNLAPNPEPASINKDANPSN
jgi:hypothetical protein